MRRVKRMLSKIIICILGISFGNVLNLNAEVIEIINKDHLNEEIYVQDQLTVLVCYATWCGPCKVQRPIVYTVDSKFKENKVCFAFCDVDTQQIICTNWNIQTVPSMIFFKGGKEIKRVFGIVREKELINLVIDGLL